MQELAITSSCDMIFAASGERRPAEKTVYLALGDDPKRLTVVQLDLSDDWWLRLYDELAPYLAAGHEPGKVFSPGQPAKSRSGSKRGQDQVSREYNTAMRKWCDETGFEPRYVTLDGGGYRYPRPLTAAYAEHLMKLAVGESVTDTA